MKVARRGRSSALLGPPLATYTATLLSDTAIPVWHEARRELPFALRRERGRERGRGGCALVLRPRDAGPARRLAIGGVVAENARDAR